MSRGNHDTLDLSHAMKFADTIRTHYGQDDVKKETFNSYLPPGMIQGLSAALFTGVALLPVRRLILSQSKPPLKTFLDLMVSVSQALAATQVGLITGSVFGCQVYLQDFNKVPATQESALADQICNAVWKSVLPKTMHTTKNLVPANPPPAWHVRTNTMLDLHNAIENCKNRTALLEEGRND